MTFHYHSDEEHKILFQRALGVIRNAAMLAELELRLGRIPQLSEFHLVSDFTDARTDQLSQDGIRAAAQIARLRRVEMAARSWTIIAPDDLKYAQARMLSMRMEAFGVRARVCRGLEEALAQLGVPADDFDYEGAEWSPPLPLKRTVGGQGSDELFVAG